MPEGWKEVRLGDLATMRRGISYAGSQVADEPPGTPILNLKTFCPGGGYRPVGLKFFRAPFDERFVLRPEQVVVANTDLTKSGDIVGAPALVPAAKGPFLHTHHVTRVDASGKILPRFLYYALSECNVRDYAKAHASGTTVLGISTDSLAAIRILLPPLPEQRKIAAILTSVDETIEKTEAVIAQLEVVKKAMLEELLTRGRGGSDHWLSVKLDDLAIIRRGASPRPIQDPRWFSETGPGWVRISDVTRSRRILRKTEQRLSPEGAARSVRIGPGDLIMSIAATIGRPILSGIDACIHDGFVFFDRLRGDVDRTFLFYVLQWKAQQFAGLGQHGTQKNINTTIVGAMAIKLPPLEEQALIASTLGAVDELCDRYEDELLALKLTKHALATALLGGDMRVNVGGG